MIKSLSFFVVAASLLLPSVHAQYGGPCLIYGPDFPAPQQPSKNPSITAAITALQAAIAAAFNGNATYGILDSANSTFSLDIYSTYEEDPLWTYHHTGSVMQQDPIGVQTVDSNTVYALGSISKLLTVYLFLLEAGDTSYNDPVTKYIPELAAYARNHAQVGTKQIDHINFEDVTVGALASQLAGIGRLIAQDEWEDVEIEGDEPGWPTPDVIQKGLCGADGYFNAACNRTQFFNVFLKRPPVVAPFQTAVYSNNGFTLLGFVLEAITGRPLSKLFKTGLVNQLGLNATTFTVPTTPNNSLVPVSYNYSNWNVDLHTINAAGGYFSTINDMRKLGRSMLNSTYLTPGQTRRWFQPHSFSGDDRGAIGSPFEMFRAATTEKVSWVYTKAGDISTFNTLVGYLPEFNIGFTVLGAFSTAATNGIDVNSLGNMIVSILYPAFEAAAKTEAASNYVGTYTDPSSNSTVVITTDQYHGLNIAAWTTNGSDVRARYLVLDGGVEFMRLVPTGLTDSVNGRTTAVAFRMIASAPLVDDNNQVITSTCFNWVNVDALMWGYEGIDSFVFALDERGRAKNVQPRAFGQTLKRMNVG